VGFSQFVKHEIPIHWPSKSNGSCLTARA